MRIVMADNGVAFDGLTPRERPLGGAESAFIALSEALAAEGADVTAYTREARPMELEGVRWRPNDALGNARARRTIACDLYIANRDPALLRLNLDAARRVFWLHNPAQFLGKPRYWLATISRRPVIVFLGPSHAGTAPNWVPAGGRRIIPYGIERPFLETARQPGIPPPRALFTSNPLRSLDRLLELWIARIRPRVAGAELHVFSGPQTYGGGGAKAQDMRAVLAQAQAAAAQGVVVREPAPKASLALELAQARALLYLGDLGETFCLAVGEAQAMGVPAVVKPVGSVGERVAHGRTGFVETDDEAFCERAVQVLTDDALWAQQSQAALATRPSLSWDRAARDFLALAS